MDAGKFKSKFLSSIAGNGISNMIGNTFDDKHLSFNSFFSNDFPTMFPLYPDPSNNYEYNSDNLAGTA